LRRVGALDDLHDRNWHDNGGVTMASCTGCGKKFGFLEIVPGGLCSKCHYLATLSPDELADIKQTAEINSAIEAIMLTTETAPNLNITKRIEIVTAECAFGMNIFKDLFAGMRDIVGGRSKAVQNTLRDSRRTALYELKKEAYEVGANAVVGVDLDYVEMSSVNSMVLLVASGTAVIIEE
jgi:uncharacterized protein YbjQ (UPF0145 family)